MAGKFLTDADVAPLFPGTWAMPVAPQIEAMYGDPRLADIPDRNPDDPWANAAVYYPLPPINPPRNTESRFLILKQDFEVDYFERLEWLNEPDFLRHRSESWGGGRLRIRQGKTPLDGQGSPSPFAA